MQTIQRIIEIPIEELQSEDAQTNWGTYNSDQCCLCGKKVGKNPKTVKIIWAEWYADMIGQKTTVGVYEGFRGKHAIDIGDRFVLLDEWGNLEVYEAN